MKWIPITESLPELGVEVLICSPRGSIWIALLTDNGWIAGLRLVFEPVAWMPLPDPYFTASSHIIRSEDRYILCGHAVSERARRILGTGDDAHEATVPLEPTLAAPSRDV